MFSPLTIASSTGSSSNGYSESLRVKVNDMFRFNVLVLWNLFDVQNLTVLILLYIQLLLSIARQELCNTLD